MRSDRRGFSLIELLIVLLIIGTLAGIAVPNLNRALLRARAVDTVADLNTVRVAVLNYQADANVWPDDADRGQTPEGLEEYLPENFSFNSEDYVLDYDDWSQTVGFVGVTVITDQRDLGLMVMELLGNNTWTNNTDKYSWVVEWTD